MSVFGQLSAIVSKLRVWGLAGALSFFRRKFNERKQAKMLRDLARRSMVAKPVRGITVIGELTAQASLSKTMRDFVLSLRDSGIPYQTYDISACCRIPAEDAADIVTPVEEFDLRKYDHIVVMYRAPIDKRLVPGIRITRIVFHDSAHGIHEMAPYLQESGDSIIAMSDFNFEYFKRAFPGQDVYKVTYPLRHSSASVTPRDELRAKYGIAAGDFVVFFNFDFGSFYRKNIPSALEAFAMAFEDVPNAKLVFKTKGAKANPRQVAEMMRDVERLGISKKFIHISAYLPRADVDGLTGACDAYLSLHHSEGFGIGMAEAMRQAKPVVATDWSANTEFCLSDNSWPVPSTMVPILPHEYPVEMKEWAAPSIDAAAKALKEIFNSPQMAAERAMRGQKFIEEHFSIANFRRDVEEMLEAR